MRAIVVGPERRLTLGDVEPPRPARDEAVVRVAAISVNRGEVRRAAAASEGWRPGWDIAGVVEAQAADGSGPASGTRVVGLLPQGGWAEAVAVPVRSLAPIPEGVSFEEAACLPVAGLTALLALGKRGDILGRDVLITGATGGVGHLACRLAKLAGARVVGAVRSADHSRRVEGYGADVVAVVGDEPAKAAAFGPYGLILESVGGASLSASLDMLEPGGVCVAFGVSGGVEASVDLQRFYLGGRTMYGFALFREVVTGEPASIGLSRLVSLVAARKLVPDISVRRPWDEIAEVAVDLVARRYAGKAVLVIR